MASSKEYLAYILEQLSELEDIRYRAMMGEYILYYRGKVVGGIYDDRFLIKNVTLVVVSCVVTGAAVVVSLVCDCSVTCFEVEVSIEVSKVVVLICSLGDWQDDNSNTFIHSSKIRLFFILIPPFSLLKDDNYITLLWTNILSSKSYIYWSLRFFYTCHSSLG